MRALGGLIVGFALSACTPVWEGRARAQQAETWRRPQVAAAHEQAAQEAPSNLPTAVPDLDALVQFGLQRNPLIRARQAAIERAAQRVDASGSLPAPRLQVVPIGEMAQTAAGEVTLMASLSQQIPAPGSLGAQVAQAAAEVRAAEAALQAARTEIAMRIRSAWWDLTLARESRAIVEQQLALLEQLQEQILQRLETANGKQSDALRIGVETDRLRSMRSVWDERSAVAQAELRRNLSLPADIGLPALAAELPPLDRYAASALQALARQHRADVLANLAKQDKAEALAAGARARHRPDFSLSFNYNLVDDRNLMAPTRGDDQWWVGVSMSLPIWAASYAAGDREAEAAQWEAALDRLAIEDDLQRDLRSALSAWQSAHEQLILYQGGMRERARQAAEAETSLYANGSSGFTEVIQATQQVLMLDLGIARLRRDAGVAEARLLQAAGLCSSRIDSDPDQHR
jgi:cobalt-zinc-cadmium efflux system outer membrane protein